MTKWEKQAAILLSSAKESDYPLVYEDVDSQEKVKRLIKFIRSGYVDLGFDSIPKKVIPETYSFWDK